MSDGVSVYECTSNDEIIDLLQGGQGVFGIAIGGVWQEIEGTLAELPSERTADADDAPAPATSSPPARRAADPPDRMTPLVDWARRLSRTGESPAGARAGTPKGQFLPGTSQAPGPRGPGSSGATAR